MRDWIRVTSSNRCPVCGKSDWCLINHDKTHVICPRVESDKRLGEAGYLHVLDMNVTCNDIDIINIVSSNVNSKKYLTEDECNKLHTGYRSSCSHVMKQRLSEKLSISVKSLDRLGIGWDRTSIGYTFPMMNGNGSVIGFRIRRMFGSKWAVSGSRSGVFVPSGLKSFDPILICEGPTDTAAALELGFSAIGRPSCSGGSKHVLTLLNAKSVFAVIVADDDEPGQRGACLLGDKLFANGHKSVVVVPPAKDIREWVKSGATRKDVEDLIEHYS